MPFAHDQKQVDKEYGGNQEGKPLGEKDLDQRQGPLQEGIGPYQRDPEKKVVMQQGFIPWLGLAAQPSAQIITHLRGLRREKLIQPHELDQFLDFFKHRLQRSFLCHPRNQRLGITVLGPAREQLEFEPSDFEKLVPDRVVNAPARRAVVVAGAGKQLEVFPYQGKRQTLRSGFRAGNLCRHAALWVRDILCGQPKPALSTFAQGAHGTGASQANPDTA